ncbi:3-methyladenine DNA glycosylase AlkD [Catalinimonas alkaloidigena]|uniref:DNA alkylation repair protein n=1 Tax=Catalinimonas alkaloidigena TaxID=1075417 RepID=UPI002405036D|nr:DNA alkylation repair protein [Catalinimonas alkaloidigena]MDF9801160.1 3-methyladenine DNA glycosylase AlkD [Catalinimonas alkaloidigena]
MKQNSPSAQDILAELKSQSNQEYLSSLRQLGVQGEKILGVKMPVIRSLAKTYHKNHELALQLWQTEIHEVRIMAGLLDDVKAVTVQQMEAWVQDFNSWDICDQTCSNLFCRTSYAYDKALAWSERHEEFVKRAGFVLMAGLAIHDKKAEDAKLAAFFPLIEREAYDERNFVKKAVNWALRQIGKRNATLRTMALLVAERLAAHELPNARWIGKDALRELKSEKIRKRLQ